LDTGGSNRNFITEISGLGMELRAGSGGSLQTMDTGPVLLSVEQAPIRQKLEIVVERDDLVGEENQIELSFHMYKGGQEQRWPVIPRLTVSLKPEANVWRIYDINLSVRAPIGDPEFLKTLIDTLLEQQQSSNEMMAAMALRSIATAETSFKSGS